jgi:hypothetical protein
MFVRQPQTGRATTPDPVPAWMAGAGSGVSPRQATVEARTRPAPTVTAACPLTGRGDRSGSSEQEAPLHGARHSFAAIALVRHCEHRATASVAKAQRGRSSRESRSSRGALSPCTPRCSRSRRRDRFAARPIPEQAPSRVAWARAVPRDRCDLAHTVVAWPGVAVISSLPAHALLPIVQLISLVAPRARARVRGEAGAPQLARRQRRS